MNILVSLINITELYRKISIKYKRFQHLYKSRKALATLNDELLKDIGISRAEATKETDKYFWQESDKGLSIQNNNEKNKNTVSFQIEKHQNI